MTWGVCGIGVLPGDAGMASALRAQDMLYTLVVKHPDGHTEDRVIGSLVNYIYAPSAPVEVIRVLTEPCCGSCRSRSPKGLRPRPRDR